LCLGIGKYTNRGVFDGAAGVCRGNRTMDRACRPPAVLEYIEHRGGPIHYSVVEPLRAIRITLDKTEHAPLAFDVTMRGSFPPSAGRPMARPQPRRVPGDP